MAEQLLKRLETLRTNVGERTQAAGTGIAPLMLSDETVARCEGDQLGDVLRPMRRNLNFVSASIAAAVMANGGNVPKFKTFGFLGFTFERVKVDYLDFQDGMPLFIGGSVLLLYHLLSFEIYASARREAFRKWLEGQLWALKYAQAVGENICDHLGPTEATTTGGMSLANYIQESLRLATNTLAMPKRPFLLDFMLPRLIASVAALVLAYAGYNLVHGKPAESPTCCTCAPP